MERFTYIITYEKFVVTNLRNEEVKVDITRLKNNRAAGPDGLSAVGKAHAPAYLQNMVSRKYAQRLEEGTKALSCPEKGRTYDMRQLQGYKPSPYHI